MVDQDGQEVRAFPHFARDEDFTRLAPRMSMNATWFLRLALAFDLDIFDDRDKLPPVKNGYAVRLLVGASDGPRAGSRSTLTGTATRTLSPRTCSEARSITCKCARFDPRRARAGGQHPVARK